MRVNQVQNNTTFKADMKIVGDVSEKLKKHLESRIKKIGDVTDTIVISLGKPDIENKSICAMGDFFEWQEESRIIKVISSIKEKNIHEHKDLSYKNVEITEPELKLKTTLDCYLDTLA